MLAMCMRKCNAEVHSLRSGAYRVVRKCQVSSTDTTCIIRNLNIYTSLVSMDNRRQISSNLISARESLAASSGHR
ncbi:unnamed protein product [Acanthoscelides obtectus]|uniref:Uncharacterized protein n=1 Tax=Acanthoscelides obtectus TaxID=200917 RepID=A0A9P0LT11_ACAOB|nr:unnamed protein product [Acanthoscelides obtectus]CAK1664047.1 hypothetical protein AOBTE_LOCUS24020 [Acanthoscelides obtectus]